ncbi:MAG TPA: oxidoreductase [Streptosporangiaceae bacterium]|nr:oxidoreductase [Streptosporangiaceae bacterium]
MSRRVQVRGGERWTEADVPDQSGRTAVITGANSGIGFETARVLAARGACVVLACRDEARAAGAAARIRGSAPGADLRVVRLDLGSLASIHAAAGDLLSACGHIDLLINNAGLMMPPRGTTEDGFELQIGINHLGHFALTGLLLPRILATPGSRVVTVSSNNHQKARIAFDDLQSERSYQRMAGYGQSKLANLLFCYELQRRLGSTGAATISVAAHPGLTSTGLARHLSPVTRAFYEVIERPLAQSAARGALPTLRAATDPDVRGGTYYGPDRWGGERGFPMLVASSDLSRDRDVQHRLWQESERLTGVTYAI